MWWRRNRKQKLANRRRRRGLTRHHMLNKVHGGGNEAQNILWLSWPKHEAWHKLWGNKSPEQVIAILSRMCRMKGRGKKYQMVA